MINVKQILQYAREQRATDIHICAGAPVLFRVARDLVPVTQDRLTARISEDLSMQLLTSEQQQIFRKRLDYDLMLSDGNKRHRVNVGYFNGAVGVVIRILPDRPSSIEELRLPPIVRQLAHKHKGFVLVTGATSQGKTTTVAAMIDEVNRNAKKHIITIEDPIEYVHENKLSMVRQREVGKDTRDFKDGLRAALRQDPDMIVIGEMRDYETIKIALTAAATGILVLSTLHIISIDKIVERMLSYAPPEEEGHIRYILADALTAVIHQELVPTLDGGKRVACEILTATDAVRNLLRRKGTYMLRNVVTMGKKHGMLSMSESLDELLTDKAISADAASSILSGYQG